MSSQPRGALTGTRDCGWDNDAADGDCVARHVLSSDDILSFM